MTHPFLLISSIPNYTRGDQETKVKLGEGKEGRVSAGKVKPFSIRNRLIYGLYADVKEKFSVSLMNETIMSLMSLMLPGIPVKIFIGPASTDPIQAQPTVCPSALTSFFCIKFCNNPVPSVGRSLIFQESSILSKLKFLSFSGGYMRH